LARWITSRDNPLTARVIVNRVWQHHFGEGLVRTPNDFGVMGDPPSHPAMLDWLAGWFVDNGWSLKRLHRLILASHTYQMSKFGAGDYADDDPDDRLLWHFPYRRLQAEAVRDAMLTVAGTLDSRMYGQSVYPYVPREALEGHSDPNSVWPAFDESTASRRTIYAFVKRSLIVPMIEVLDFCDTARSAPVRQVTSVAPQALSLFNGQFVNRQAEHFAQRLVREAGADPAAQIGLAYRLALSRPPTDQELKTIVEFLQSHAAGSEGLAADDAARPAALVQVCRVIFNLNEFVYTD
jgi:hypothetical protein